RRGASPFAPSKEASASGSITLLATKKTPFEATMAGLRLRGSESAATTRRPPLLTCCAACPHFGQSARALDPARKALRDTKILAIFPPPTIAPRSELAVTHPRAALDGRDCQLIKRPAVPHHLQEFKLFL